VRKLSIAARVYVSLVITGGLGLLLANIPTDLERPWLALALLVVSALSSGLKINLPLSRSWSTMSVSYAVDLTALLLIGPRATMMIGVISALIQCSFRQRVKQPFYRTAFSMATLAMTVWATALAYRFLGGADGALAFPAIVKPLVGASTTYFLLNTGLVAGAIALSTRQPLLRVWNDNFLWSAPSYFVGAGAAAIAAIVIQHSGYWMVPLAAAPLYLSYRTYKIYLGRIEDERRHVEKMSELHRAAMDALALAKRSEAIAEAEKEQLAVTLQSIGDGVITTDIHGKIQILNKIAEHLTGWWQQEAEGLPITSVVQIVDRETGAPCRSTVETVLETRQRVTRQQRTLIARNATERYIEDSAAPICDRDGNMIGVVTVFQDVTDKIKMEEERLKASKLESLGILAGGIAHDFNNILTAIIGNIALTRMGAHIDPQSATRLSEAEDACVRAQALTYQLLTFSKGGAPVKKPMHLADMLRDAARFALRGSNVSCEFSAAPDLWPVEADEGQINQVINNIVINAKQAMPLGGTIQLRCRNVDAAKEPHPGLPPDAQYMRISVEDHGVGIPNDNLTKVFDPYFSTKQKGSGLGLATSHSIVKNHGGHLTVESEVGVGTTFHVYLPRSSRPVPKQTVGDGGRPHSGQGRVLVMDDEEMIRNVTGQMLARLGYDVELVTNGAEAISTFKRAKASGNAFDAVIMDLTVPGGMGGKEAITHLAAIEPDVKAIVSSGYADDPVMAEFRHYGFSGVVAKPFTIRDLGRALHELLQPKAGAPV